jgi:hypothetical protein
MPSDEPLSLPPGARAMLRAPDAVTRTIAAVQTDPERRWLLRQARAIRRSFVEEVIDGGAGPAAQRRWMLLQDDDVRLSYVDDVLTAALAPDREAIWLLRQSPALRASYVADVLDAGSDRARH